MQEQQFLEKVADDNEPAVQDEKTFFIDHNPVDKDVYFDTKTDAIVEGKRTWMVKGFDSEDHRTYQFFSGGVLAGYFYHDLVKNTFLAWIINTDNDVPSAVYEGDSIIEAKNLVEQLV